MKNIIQKHVCKIVTLVLLNVFIFVNLNGQVLPYKNPRLSVEERVNDLLKRMTIEEKVSQMLKLNLENIKRDQKGKVPAENHWRSYLMVRVSDVSILRVLIWKV